MSLDELIERLIKEPDRLTFKEVIDTIDAHYDYTPSRFSNGLGEQAQVNQAGHNEGSCKVFAFARKVGLNEAQTLACFAEHHRAVLAEPTANSHQNIRQFMRSGWAGIRFEQEPLRLR